jgi:hypothetical protein
MDELTIQTFASAFYSIQNSIYNLFKTLYERARKWH